MTAEIITEERLSLALQYLARTDDEAAELKADVARSEYLAKLREAFAFTEAGGKNADERKARAKIEPASQTAWETYFKAIAAFEKVRAKRESETLIVDVWRSINANRRQGNI